MRRTGKVIKKIGEPVFDDLLSDKAWWWIIEEVAFTYFSVEVSGRLILTDSGWEIDEGEIDTLGLSAAVRQYAREYVAAGEFDKAWRTLMEHQLIPMNDPQNQRYWLPYSHHVMCADILRREKKHSDALIHMLMFYIADKASTDRQLANIEATAFGQKEAESRYSYSKDRLRIYLSRCKFKNVQLEDVLRYAETVAFPPIFRDLQEQVSIWKSAPSQD